MNKKQEKELKNRLINMDKKALIDLYLQKCFDTDQQISDAEEHIDSLELQLREQYQLVDKKDKQLRIKIGNMKSTDFIKMCIESGFMVEAKEANNQEKINFTIDALYELKSNLRKRVRLMNNDEHCYSQNAVLWDDIVMNIMNQIEQLEKGGDHE